MKQITLIILLVLLPLSVSSVLYGEVFFYHTDNFGTPMAMTDMAGKVVWRSDELPFGEEHETIENPIENNRRFLGKEIDEATGLIYMGSRYLDPKTGRFIQPDPVGLVDPATGKVNQEMLLNPQRQNRYVYGLNNPYRYVDPDGKVPKDIENSGFNPYELEDTGVRYGGGNISGKAFGKALWQKITGKTPKKAKADLPVLDSTGKVHGQLPSPKNLSRYPNEKLKQLQGELKQSVQQRIKKNIELGSDKAHGQRQAAEQQLIKSIDKKLKN